MAGYIGSKASVVSSGAERKKTFTITGATTSLTGLNYTVGKVHVFQNGVRLVDGTDYTATNGTTITLTVAAQNGDNVVVISQASFQLSESYTSAEADAEFVAKTGDTMTGNLNVTGTVIADELSVSDAGKLGFNTTGSYTINSVPSPDFGLGYTVSTNPMNLSGYYGIAFATNRTEAMRIGTSGNVGIGVVPESGVSADVTELDLGLMSLSLWKGEGQPNDGASYGYNCYKTGGLTYKAKVSSNSGDFRPAVYEQIYGQHRFKVASSATADSIISFDEAMRINSSGYVLINRTSQLHGGRLCLDYIGGTDAGMVLRDTTSSGTGVPMQFANGATTIIGSITHNQSSTSFNTSSDYRLKENVVDLTGASARVNQLNPSRFNWIADETNTLVDGFLAHEVATVVPEAITGTKDAMKDEEYEVTPAVLDDDGNVTTEAVMGTRSVPDYQGIDQSKLVPLLTAALQEALTEIASLKTRVEALEA